MVRIDLAGADIGGGALHGQDRLGWCGPLRPCLSVETLRYETNLPLAIDLPRPLVYSSQGGFDSSRKSDIFGQKRKR
jgi:hypothetical protein